MLSPSETTQLQTSRYSNPDTPRRSRADTMPTSTIPPFGFGANLYNPLNLSQQRPNRVRSGSLSTPDLPVYSESSSPLDENASSTIASTLASLGLGDDSQSEPFFEPVTRHRAYTVNAQTMETPKPVGFGAFVPHKFSPALKQRPRAISLGRSDTPVLSGTSFAPFDMSYSNHHPRNDFGLDHPLRCSQLSQRFDDAPIVDGENDEIQVN